MQGFEMEFKFSKWPHNRLTFPTKWVLVCEDAIDCQKAFLDFFMERYGHQGDVLVAVAPCAIMAIGLYQFARTMVGEPMAVVIDHDMPWGTGPEAISYLRQLGYAGKIIAASGIPQNNDRLVQAGADYVARGKGQDENLGDIMSQIEANFNGEKEIPAARV